MIKPPRTAETASASIDHVLATVAARLRNARKQRKLTQKQLAEKAGLQYSYVYEIETGKTNITLRTLIALAEALHIDVPTLFPVTDSLASSTSADEVLHAFMDKALSVLQDCERLDAERQQQNSGLLSDLKSIMHLRTTVETPAPPVKESEDPPGYLPKAKGGDGKRADRSEKSG